MKNIKSKRIVFEENDNIINIDSINNSSHVGFMTQVNNKGYIQCVGHREFMALIKECDTILCNLFFSTKCETIKSLVSYLKNNNINHFEVFDSANDLHEWLSKDN